MNKSRLLQVFVLFFGVILLGLQIYNYIYIKQLDAKYSEIISKKTRALQAFAIITRESSDIQNSLLQISILNGGNTDKWQSEITQSENRIDSQYSTFANVTSKKEKASIALLLNSYSKYKSGYKQVLALLMSGQASSEEASDGVEKLKGTYYAFLQDQEAQTEFFRQRAERSSNKLSVSSHNTSRVLLFVGTLPYLLLICALIIALVIIIWLGNVVNWFRHQE